MSAFCPIIKDECRNDCIFIHSQKQMPDACTLYSAMDSLSTLADGLSDMNSYLSSVDRKARMQSSKS